jgi:hypothetical protein
LSAATALVHKVLLVVLAVLYPNVRSAVEGSTGSRRKPADVCISHQMSAYKHVRGSVSMDDVQGVVYAVDGPRERLAQRVLSRFAVAYLGT